MNKCLKIFSNGWGFSMSKIRMQKGKKENITSEIFENYRLSLLERDISQDS